MTAVPLTALEPNNSSPKNAIRVRNGGPTRVAIPGVIMARILDAGRAVSCGLLSSSNLNVSRHLD